MAYYIEHIDFYFVTFRKATQVFVLKTLYADHSALEVPRKRKELFLKNFKLASNMKPEANLKFLLGAFRLEFYVIISHSVYKAYTSRIPCRSDGRKPSI